ncbi:hypothetical protein FSP39_024048 [Pinctada imbricata]|uniref:Flavodoxin-like fold domain-containing protein n=1 Tax=Pinctada imbricata TaxID=66713 RepID=A0AA88Y9G1_PINIB|nr:hypothetical protein FSP39_024048 [Pinctada imbricata]
MAKRNVLIVFAHLDSQTSFNGALKDKAVQILSSQGYSVSISDLYVQNFDPRESKDINKGDVTDEQDKLRQADLVIFQFPLYWSSVPAILKGWFDRVLEKGVIYNLPDEIFEKGFMRGKKALLSFTTGESGEHFTSIGKVDMKVLIWHILWGTLGFVGFDVPNPQVFYAPALKQDKERQKMIDDWAARLQHIFNEEPMSFSS